MVAASVSARFFGSPRAAVGVLRARSGRDCPWPPIGSGVPAESANVGTPAPLATIPSSLPRPREEVGAAALFPERAPPVRRRSYSPA